MYEVSESLCGPQQAPPAGMAYNCRKTVDLTLVAIDSVKTDSQWEILIPVAG